MTCEQIRKPNPSIHFRHAHKKTYHMQISLTKSHHHFGGKLVMFSVEILTTWKASESWLISWMTPRFRVHPLAANRYIYIYMIPVRGSLPPPPHGMVPKPAFCSILHENVVFAVFLARWVAGAVRKPANAWDFLPPTFRKRVICNVSASTSWSSAVAPTSISNCDIILNLLK